MLWAAVGRVCQLPQPLLTCQLQDNIHTQVNLHLVPSSDRERNCHVPVMRQRVLLKQQTPGAITSPGATIQKINVSHTLRCSKPMMSAAVAAASVLALTSTPSSIPGPDVPPPELCCQFTAKGLPLPLSSLATGLPGCRGAARRYTCTAAISTANQQRQPALRAQGSQGASLGYTRRHPCALVITKALQHTCAHAHGR